MKLSKILPLLILCLVLSGCNIAKNSREIDEQHNVSMFVEVEKAVNWSVLYHKDTKVMYVCSTGGYNSGNMTVMLDENGKPLLWKGEMTNEND